VYNPFNNGLSDYRLTSIEITLCSLNHNKTTLTKKLTFTYSSIWTICHDTVQLQ